MDRLNYKDSILVDLIKSKDGILLSEIKPSYENITRKTETLTSLQERLKRLIKREYIRIEVKDNLKFYK